MITKGKWKAWRFSKYHNWKVSMGDRNEFLDLGMEEESEANAQLIAQSPRMAEWLAKVAKQDFVVFPEDRKLAREIIQTLDS